MKSFVWSPSVCSSTRYKNITLLTWEVRYFGVRTRVRPALWFQRLVISCFQVAIWLKQRKIFSQPIPTQQSHDVTLTFYQIYLRRTCHSLVTSFKQNECQHVLFSFPPTLYIHICYIWFSSETNFSLVIEMLRLPIDIKTPWESSCVVCFPFELSLRKFALWVILNCSLCKNIICLLKTCMNAFGENLRSSVT